MKPVEHAFGLCQWFVTLLKTKDMEGCQHRTDPADGAVPKICFVIPYFGDWPFWFPLFLESCRANPSINWLLYTDCGIPDEVPSNVRIVETSFSSYCDRVGSTLDIVFRPSNPYKLCDLKPALGYIHQSELDGFDFWAFGDIDLIYGDLRRHFTTKRLSRHDLYSTHQRRISGHCCLLRNTVFMRGAFMRVRNWKQLLSTREHVAFDESAFSHMFIRHKNWPSWLSKLVNPLNALTRRTENIEAFSTPNAKIPWIDGSKAFPTLWYWDKGRLTNNQDGDRQFPYFHFLVWKREWRHYNAALASDLSSLATLGRWQISADGFSERR